MATLGDLLLVLPSHQLNSIPVDSWTDAADTLTEETSYHIKVEWPGMVDQIQLYQVTLLCKIFMFILILDSMIFHLLCK
jgi:hypothetical protein